MKQLCVHWKRKMGYIVDRCDGAQVPKIWMGNPEILRVSTMEDKLWKDQYFPEGDWRIVEVGNSFIHADCMGILEQLADYDIGDKWKIRHTCKKCGKKLDFEVV